MTGLLSAPEVSQFAVDAGAIEVSNILTQGLPSQGLNPPSAFRLTCIIPLHYHQAIWMHLGVVAPLLQPPPLPGNNNEPRKSDAPGPTPPSANEDEVEAEAPRQPETQLEAAAAAIAESSLRLLTNLVAHGNGGAEALRALGGVEALQSGSTGPHSGFERVRGIWKRDFWIQRTSQLAP